MKHTPGPWNIEKIYFVAWQTKMQSHEDEPLNDLALQGPHTHERAVELKKEMHAIGLMATVIQCTSLKEAYYALNGTYRHVTAEESKQRAALIAAAPEMLEALMAVHSAHCGDIYDFKAPSMPEAILKAIDAIQKARGES